MTGSGDAFAVTSGGDVTYGSARFRTRDGYEGAMIIRRHGVRPSGGVKIRVEDGRFYIYWLNADGNPVPIYPGGLESVRVDKDSVTVLWSGLEPQIAEVYTEPISTVPAMRLGLAPHVPQGGTLRTLHHYGEPPEGYDYMLEKEGHVGED